MTSNKTRLFANIQVPSSRKRKSRPIRKRRSCLGSLFVFGVKAGVVTILLWAVVAMGFYAWALTFDLREVFEMPQRSVVYGRDGEIYSRLAGENRLLVPFDKVSNHFVNALMAREDTPFYSHHGIDPIGIARPVVRNFIAGGFREGASTITQQLARNSFPLGGKTLQRKLIEAAVAYRIETELSKEEILEAYMNRIFFGSGFYGVEAASQAYFGKPAARLDLGESAILAGLIRSPNRISPFRNYERSLRERDAVLKRMEDVGFISESQRLKASATPPKIARRPITTPQQNWAMDSILMELDLVLDRIHLETGGLKIYTTIDASLQSAAEKSLASRLRQAEQLPGFRHAPKDSFARRDFSAEDFVPYLEGAAIAIDSQTGGILAIVGGRDLGLSRFNRAFLGRRQIGSAIKPFVYAKAFEGGLKPRDKISDDKLSPHELPQGSGSYNPSNHDGTFRGMLRVEDGLVLSRNTISVRVGMKAGIDPVAETIKYAGIASDPPRYPALFLGAFESNLKDLTAAYTVFSTGGVKLQPYLIERVEDAKGNLLFKATRGKIPVLEPKAAAMTTEILQDVIRRGTGSSARRLGVPRDAAGKTGTSNDYRDAWFVGFDGRLTVGVWVGFDQPKPIMPGGSGATLALPIWADIMRAGTSLE